MKLLKICSNFETEKVPKKSALRKISKRISIKVKSKKKMPGKRKVIKEQARRRYKIMERRKGDAKWLFLFQEYTGLLWVVVHFNIIIKYTAISKVVCGKLVRDNWMVLRDRALRLFWNGNHYGYCNMRRGNDRYLFVTRRLIITSNANSTGKRTLALTTIHILIYVILNMG